MKTLFVAIAAMGLLSASQMASASTTSQQVSISVSAEGLDLTRASDIRRLNTRVADAAAEACDPSDRMITKPLPDFKCRRQAIASAAAEVAEMTLAAKRGAIARN